MVATTQFQTQRVGALPVIARFCQRLQLGPTVDRTVPGQGDVPLGELVEILVANRLLEPKALYRLGSWATQATLADSYNLTEQQLHDDRIGRALERVADVLVFFWLGLSAYGKLLFRLTPRELRDLGRCCAQVLARGELKHERFTP